MYIFETAADEGMVTTGVTPYSRAVFLLTEGSGN